MSQTKSCVFCYECLEDVTYITCREERLGSIKGKKYPYIAMIARCKRCNEVLDVYNDENLKILYDAYREKHNLISLQTVRAIPGKYFIGKSVLSALLGWGEVTFTRYFDGYLPTKQYSDILVKIYEDPLYYLTILEAGKNRISEVAYRKSKRAVQELLTADSISKEQKMREFEDLLEKPSLKKAYKSITEYADSIGYELMVRER